jgi:CheY-like chemotaxis protein
VLSAVPVTDAGPLAHLKTSPIDFLIADWNLPKLSGLDLVKRVRQLEKYKDLPILMISGRSQKEDIVTAVQAGIDNYIIKPFTALQLKEKMQQVIQGRDKDSPLKKELEQFVAGHEAFSRREGTPFMIFGEPVDRLEELAEPSRQTNAQCLVQAGKAIADLNSQYAQLKLGYTLLVNTNDIIRYVKAGSIRKRIGLIAVAIDCKGNVPLLARLLGANPDYGFPVVVVCDQLNDISGEQLTELESYGVSVLERQELSLEAWKAMLAKFASQYVNTGSSQEDGQTLFDGK